MINIVMMLLSKCVFISIICTQIAYTLNVKDFSDKLYHDIAKNFTNQHSESADTHVELLNPKYVKRVELVLLRKYGEKEVNYFRNMLKEYQQRELHSKMNSDDQARPLFDYTLKDHVNEHFDEKYVREFSRLDDPNDNSDELVTARIIIKLIKHEFEKFNLIKDQYITPNMERFTQIKHLSQDLQLYTDTPCSTQAGCDKLAMLMNLCSYIRGGTALAYDIFATMVHVLGNMLAVLCACIFVGPAQVCLLKNFPVKITTNLCRVYGGMHLALFIITIDIGFGSRFS